jgi:hypothetical protein
MWLPFLSHGLKEVAHSLLRDDIIKLLSISRLEWQSLFCSNKLIDRTTGSDLGCLFTPGLPVDPVHMTPEGFWDDFEAMYLSLSSSPEAKRRPAWLVAFSIVETDAYLRERTKDNPFTPMPIYDEPLALSPNWKLIGYDVKQQTPAFSQGLGTLVAPEEHEQVTIKQRWGSKLSRYHLFETQEDAVSYSSLFNSEQEEITTYLVFGVYLIAKFP